MHKNLNNPQEYVRLLQSLLNKLDGLPEVLRNIESLMIFPRNILIEGDFGAGMVETGSTRSSKHSLNAEFFVGDGGTFQGLQILGRLEVADVDSTHTGYSVLYALNILSVDHFGLETPRRYPIVGHNKIYRIEC